MPLRHVETSRAGAPVATGSYHPAYQARVVQHRQEHINKQTLNNVGGAARPRPVPRSPFLATPTSSPRTVIHSCAPCAHCLRQIRTPDLAARLCSSSGVAGRGLDRPRNDFDEAAVREGAMSEIPLRCDELRSAVGWCARCRQPSHSLLSSLAAPGMAVARCTLMPRSALDGASPSAAMIDARSCRLEERPAIERCDLAECWSATRSESE
jgi:hypothetical protein